MFMLSSWSQDDCEDGAKSFHNLGERSKLLGRATQEKFKV